MNAVEFHNVSKTYRLYDAPPDRLLELASGGRFGKHREFHALRDLSFSVRRGEVFCIIGENGSGKSTTLKVMAGISEASAGEVKVNGRVAALLELGSGFNPEFTGRQNAWLNASILGLTRREIEARMQSVEEFAGIGDFIDQPVKTYSSGMVLRLAFSVAIASEPEILIVDEALAVGDASFRHRCMRRVQELRARGVTIVFVSHSIADVKAVGDRVLWLRHGEMVALADTETVVALYLKDMMGIAAPVSRDVPEVRGIPNIDQRRGDTRAEITGFSVTGAFGEPLHLMTPGSRAGVHIAVRAEYMIAGVEIGFRLRNHLGLDFAESVHTLPELRAGRGVTVSFDVEIPELYPGAFSFSPFVRSRGDICDWIDNAVTVQMARAELPVYGYFHVPCRIESGACV